MEPGTELELPSFCELLGELFGQAFVDWAIGIDADPYSRLIGSLEPRCVVHDQIAAINIKAIPADGMQFPPQRPDDVKLMLGDQDITTHIDAWDIREIRFSLPEQSHSAPVYLQGPFVAHNGLSDRTLGRILDVGAGLTDIEVRFVPGALMGVIYPPEIRLFTINGQEVTEEPILVEACRETDILWQVGMNCEPGFGVPDCARLDVKLVDEGGNALADRDEAVGRIRGRSLTPGNRSIELIATIYFEQTEIGQVRYKANLLVIARIQLQMRVPNEPRLIGSQHATVRASISCKAPRDGTRIGLASSDARILSVPNSVIVPEAATSADFIIYSRPGQSGQITITATADDYAPVELQVEVLDPHTAIVLSGGGAKGDFEVGSCSYLLHHRWDELNVKSVIGTSVGSINVLGLATNNGLATAHIMEDEWLGLKSRGDMFRVAPWIGNIYAESEIDISNMLLSIAGSGGGVQEVYPWMDSAR